MTWQRTLKPVLEFLEPLTAPEGEALRPWLENRATAEGLKWLLAHADDGVIWGRFENGGLLTAREATDDTRSGPDWRELTLQQVRAFSEEAELLLWREDGENWRARLIRAAKSGEIPSFGEAFDETQLLWGLTGEAVGEDRFTRLQHGGIGCTHVPPLAVALKDGKPDKPLCLIVRNYLNGNGSARIEASRLAGFAFSE